MHMEDFVETVELMDFVVFLCHYLSVDLILIDRDLVYNGESALDAYRRCSDKSFLSENSSGCPR